MKKIMLTIMACCAILAGQAQSALNGSDPGLQQLPTLNPGVGPAVVPGTGYTLSPGEGPQVKSSAVPTLNPGVGPEVNPNSVPILNPGIGPAVNVNSPVTTRPWNATYGTMYYYPVSPSDFQQLLNTVNAQAFQDTQLAMIKVAGLCGWFTSAQCAALMRVFTFDDNRLKVVSYLAPHLINPFDTNPIMSNLTFDSSRRSAWNIIAAAHRH